MTTGDDDSIAERLAKADRAIQRAKLEERIRELGGIVGRPTGESEDAPEAGLAFLSHVMAWETGPLYRRDHRLPQRD